ncbi:STAS domain-containing protein [Nocardia sp. NBC_01499]|uniref:STAS domain-containing protein n=1 Tax=Nocardia sp. NBC_01499 TaxID=2903597 RepID=UPI00386DD949
MTNQVSPRQPRMSRRLLSHSHHSAKTSEFSRGQLRIRGNTPRPGIRVLTVIGELDLATAPLLDRVVRDSESTPAMVVDMSEIGFLGFAGVDVLVRAAERADHCRRRFAVVVSTRPTQRVFELTDAYARMWCFPRVDIALCAVTDSGS